MASYVSDAESRVMRRLDAAMRRCGPALEESFPFMLPGWRAEPTPGDFIMISPCVAAERRQTENGD